MQSFILSILPPTLLFPPLILALLLRPLSFNRLNTLPTGPTPLVFALLAQYYASIPHVRKYHVITSSTRGISDGITLSDKSVNYLLACQLAFSSVPGSIIVAGVGWSIGVAWRHELGPATWARWRVSGRVVGESTEEGDGVESLGRRREGEQGRATGLKGIGGDSRNRGNRIGIVA